MTAKPKTFVRPWYPNGAAVKAGDGHYHGWCNSCGADVFDGIRHRCPPKIGARINVVLHSAKAFRDAHSAVMCSSAGTPNNARLVHLRELALTEFLLTLSRLEHHTVRMSDGGYALEVEE